MPRDAKDIIGEAALADLLKDYDVTPKSPKPEPKRLVTMEESARRFLWINDLRPHEAGRVWSRHDVLRENENAADNWLVRTVNRLVIEGLPRPRGSTDAGWAELGAGSCNFALRTALLRTFCGEGVP